jgi:hypothetical protein
MLSSLKILLIAAVSSGLLLGCDNHLSIDQQNICMVDQAGYETVSATCKEGQKVLFIPDVFGNKQMPVVFAGMYCDLRYQVVHNEGGVACVFKLASRPEGM